ncbi:MAG: protease HtpX [Planctomycetota bacterium]|nr:MAG: protease HtpX [Planctomycetota bacterium]
MRFLNGLKTTLLLASMMGLCLLIGSFFGRGGLLIGLIFGGFGNILAFFFSDKIAIAAMRGREISREQAPALFDMIERLAQRAGLPMPRVYVCPQEAPNAFATGRSPRNAAVAITEGMLRSFPMHEIEGVMAHELAHIKNRDMLISTVASVMAGVISFLGWMAMWGVGRDRDNPLGAIGGLLMVLLAPIAATIIQLAISRQREYAADAYGGQLCGNPLKLAAALARLDAGNRRIPMDTPPTFHNLYIVQPLSAGGMASLFSTHPPIEKRIEALRRQAEQMR